MLAIGLEERAHQTLQVLHAPLDVTLSLLNRCIFISFVLNLIILVKPLGSSHDVTRLVLQLQLFKNTRLSDHYPRVVGEEQEAEWSCFCKQLNQKKGSPSCGVTVVSTPDISTWGGCWSTAYGCSAAVCIAIPIPLGPAAAAPSASGSGIS